MRNSALDIAILVLKLITGAVCTIDHLELTMPRYARRGGDVTLKCEHSVAPEQLYKVEWRKGDNKIFQYVKGRKPPFRSFPLPGIEINNSNSNERQVQLSKVDFATSGVYSCTVSMETPIFTKDSEEKFLTIIEPQLDDPKIQFDKELYEIGDILVANCTSTKSRPPPHITWLVNDEKVNDEFTKSFSTVPIHGHGFFEQKGFSVKQLSVEVSDLHVRNDNTIKFTCMATIPGYVGNVEEYADNRTATAEIDVELTEAPVEAISNSNVMISSNSSIFVVNLFLLLILFILLLPI